VKEQTDSRFNPAISLLGREAINYRERERVLLLSPGQGQSQQGNGTTLLLQPVPSNGSLTTFYPRIVQNWQLNGLAYLTILDLFICHYRVLRS